MKKIFFFLIFHLTIISPILFTQSCIKLRNRVPTCNISIPDDETDILKGDSIIITVHTDDTDGYITEVRFYIDNEGVGSSSSFPYNYIWQTETEIYGYHEITAIVKDNEGGSGTDSKTVYLYNESGVFNCGSKVSDYDGNKYNTILIGSQCWMAENLATTHYSNGIQIPNVTNNNEWEALGANNIDDACCWYNNDLNNKVIYGALYTWAAAMGGNAVSSNTNPSGVQGACPTGWHLPSDNEWKQLEMQLGMSQSDVDNNAWRGTDQANQLAGDSSLWNNGVLVNNKQFGTSGFMGIPGGYRFFFDGSFIKLGNSGKWRS